MWRELPNFSLSHTGLFLKTSPLVPPYYSSVSRLERKHCEGVLDASSAQSHVEISPLVPPSMELQRTRSHIWFELHPRREHQISNTRPKGLSKKVTRCHLKGLPTLAAIQCHQFPTVRHLTGPKNPLEKMAHIVPTQ